MRVIRRGPVGIVAGGTLAVVLAACGGGGQPAPTDSGAPPSPSASSGPVTSSGSTGGATTQSAGGVDSDEAGRIATDKYGGQVIDVESDSEKGKSTWEVEIKHSKKGRIEVDVAKDTGEIVTMEPED